MSSWEERIKALNVDHGCMGHFGKDAWVWLRILHECFEFGKFTSWYGTWFTERSDSQMS
jgi:hypothetical protein